MRKQNGNLRKWCLSIFLLALPLVITGCPGDGGGGSTAVAPTPVPTKTPAISYGVGLTATKGSAASITPSNSGGVATACSISPNLPAGLVISSACIISGTPTVLFSASSFTVTASNSAGTSTATVSITVNEAPPSGLVYSSSPAIYSVGQVITNNSPTSSGGAVSSYSISPSLPVGLSFNTVTGVISGTPTAITSILSYSVTATNAVGSTNLNLDITVNDVMPSGLSYSASTPTYYVGMIITNNTPTSVGGAVVSYSINPSLPAGLVFNTSTGTISGTPTATSATTTYTITATNTGGNANANVAVTISYPVMTTNIKRINQMFESGFVVGTAIPSVAQVGCQFDGGTVFSATGTTSWSCQLPNSSLGWSLGSSHDVTVGIKSGVTITSPITYNFLKGHNRDINGDGYPDLIIGAPFDNSNTGKVYIYYGSASGVSTTANTSIVGTVSGEWFGSAVALGDLDGDGYADLIVGASHYNSQAGIVYIFNGSSIGLPGSASSSIASPLSSSGFGGSLAAGNIYNGGYTDLAVGAPYGNSVYEFRNTSGAVSSTPTTTLTSGTSDRFGASVAIGNYFNSSYGDIFVGATLGGATNQGTVYVCRGNSSGSQNSFCGVNWTGPLTGAFFGASLSISFDYNGYENMSVGASSANGGAGIVYYYTGPGTSASLPSSPSGSLSGASSSGAGSAVGYFDLNGDGFQDFLTGASNINSVSTKVSAINSGATAPYYSTGSTFSGNPGGFGYSIGQ